MARDVPILLLGGTFDPVHEGHLHIARNAQRLANGAPIHFMPCNTPPHRPPPKATTAQRLDMLRIALTDTSFVLNDCEIQRGGVSWTKDTVRTERARHGKDRPLCWLLGADAYEGFYRWQGWQEILSDVHLMVCARPPVSVGVGDERIGASLARDFESLCAHPAGLVWHLTIPPFPSSSSAIRNSVVKGSAPRVPEGWLSEGVQEYINCHRLYQDE